MYILQTVLKLIVFSPAFSNHHMWYRLKYSLVKLGVSWTITKKLCLPIIVKLFEMKHWTLHLPLYMFPSHILHPALFMLYMMLSFIIIIKELKLFMPLLLNHYSWTWYLIFRTALPTMQVLWRYTGSLISLTNERRVHYCTFGLTHMQHQHLPTINICPSETPKLLTIIVLFSLYKMSLYWISLNMIQN